MLYYKPEDQFLYRFGHQQPWLSHGYWLVDDHLVISADVQVPGPDGTLRQRLHQWGYPYTWL